MPPALELIRAQDPPNLIGLGVERPRTELRVSTILSFAIATLLIGNLGRIPIFSTGGRDVPILVNDLAVAALIFASAIVMAVRGTFRLDWVSGFALLFAGAGGISAMLAVPRFNLTNFEAFVSIGYLLRWIFYFSIYVSTINVLRASEVNRLWAALEWTILVFALFGIFQSIFLPGFAQIVYPDSRPMMDWDVQGRRLVSTFLDPNFAGAFIDIGLITSLARLATGARVARWKLLVLGVALVLTVSRSSILALLVGGSAILVITGLSKRLMRVVGATVVLVLLALPKLLALALEFHKLSIDPSAMARLQSWSNGWTVLKDHWLIGIGFNSWGYVSERYGWIRLWSATYGIDGGLFFVLVLTGIVGLSLYLTMLVLIIRNARSVWRDPRMSPGHRGLAIAAAASIPMIVVHSLFTNSLLLPFLMEPLWLLWAIPFVLASKR
jgi:hypothetical protein